METKIKSAVNEVGHLLDSWLPLRLLYDKVPGISIAIVYKGDVILNKAYGYADPDKTTWTDEITLYRVGSISKLFTSTAIMLLVEQGKVKLEDPVAKYLFWFKGENRNGRIEDITIKQLLSHTSGLWSNGDTAHWFTNVFPSNIQSIPPEALILKPGSAFKYSNYGYAVSGLLIEMVGGVPYENYIQNNILNKLGMSSTCVDYRKDLQNIASSIGREIPGSERERYGHYCTNAYAPATGFVSSVLELAKFIATIPIGAKETILKNESKLAMCEEPSFYTRGNDKYGLGLEMYEVNNKKLYGHGGGFKGFVSQVAIDAENDLGVVVLANASKAPVWTYAQSILQAIYSLVEDEAEYTAAAKGEGKTYEGIYRNSGEDKVVVKVKDTLVSFDINTSSPLFGTNKTVLVPLKEDVFMQRGGNGFSSIGENVVFSEFRNGVAQKIISGPTPLERISHNQNTKG